MSTSKESREPDTKQSSDKEAEAEPREPSAIVCLGASAGGLEALQEFFEEIPADTGAAYVLILHLSPDFKSLMPELLARHTKMAIRPAAHATRLSADTITIIPPGKNMVYREGELLLRDQDRAPGHTLHLPIDIFLRSLAEDVSTTTLGVILSGTGSDGSRGIRVLKDAGGIVLAQRPESARFDGMPRCAIETGAVDATGTPRGLAGRVADIVKNGAMLENSEGGPGSDMNAVLDVMRSKLSTDFSYLRPRMLMRRVRRRMALLGIDSLTEYARILRSTQGEAKALQSDLFIGVTGFFRDGLSFERLKAHLATNLLHEESDEPLRIWVPSCASGEEAYSMLILVLEVMEQTGIRRAVKLFATDIDEESLSRASRATYSASDLAELSSTRLARHFVHHGETMSIHPSLREMVICAQHNLVTDPPFTRIDLVSCRNFLIYLEQQAQEQVLASLHFALKPNGTLFLGSAEALGRLEGEFDTIDSKSRIFRKSRNVVLPSMRRRAGMNDPLTILARSTPSAHASQRDPALRQVLESLTEGEGVSVAILSTEGQLVETLSDPLQAFHLPKGRPTSDAVRLVKRSLSAALTTALQRMRRGEPEARCAVTLDEPRRSASVRLKRLPATGSMPERLLLLIEAGRAVAEQVELGELDADDAPDAETSAAVQLTDLQIELQQTRESLQATIEELQSSNEEQQSTNEELIASNEELQSTNEELQSVNEELFTVNVEHQGKIQELAVLAADLDNLLRAIDVGTMFLDHEFCIRKFTPSIDRVVRLVDHDIGRSFIDFAHGLGPNFNDDLRRVFETGLSSEHEIRGPKGTWLLVRVLPYMAQSGKPSGVVVTVVDVTATRNAREMTRLANEQLADANRRLSRQREELEDLFSIVAHDMKRPVLALDGLMRLAEEETDEASKAPLLAKALEECARMRRMLEDLGHVSGMARRAVPMEEVDLQPWCDALLDRVRAEADERRVRLNVVCDSASVTIPRAALEESAMNLLENALRYGCTNPEPRVDMTCLVRDGGLELTVRDNGVGIAPEDHKKVFEPFRRLHPDLAEGSGLGLMAARRVISRHGGSIRLESEPDQGSKFTVRLPIGGAPGPVSSETSARPKVLLVEDDSLDSRLIQRFLGDAVSCTHVKMLSEAENQLQRELFDLVLLDLSLPDGHGLELVHRMRDLLGTPIPIVVVTGHGEGLAPSALTESIAGFVPKAEMRKEQLAEVVQRALAPSTSQTWDRLDD